MGLLTVGKAFTFDEAKDYRQYVLEHGVIQFLNVFNMLKDECCAELLWGDEVEYGIFAVDLEKRTIQLSCRGSKVLEELKDREKSSLHRCEGCTWHPEYGCWMVEATPRRPFSGYAADLLRVERNMRLRRKRILSVLLPDEIAPTVTCLPTMGVSNFVKCGGKLNGPIANSDYVPDSIINPHPRFGALTRNIRIRRGSKVDIQMPLYWDKYTPEFQGIFKNGGPFKRNNLSIYEDPLGGQNSKETMKTLSNGHAGDSEWPTVHMDAMAFGMGCCCLQVTFQARDIEESRFMYDQLAVLAPVMLALSAATPVFRGRLLDSDVRWAVISASVDDRTLAERGISEMPYEPSMVAGGQKRLLKSRYGSISTYIHYCKRRADNPMYVLEKYNDIPCEINEKAYDELIRNNVDPALANHIAHLFTRDPLVIFENNISEVNDMTETDHFENIQSTNWQTVRWKPPPLRKSEEELQIGWRTEFRSMEVQITDLENAAFTVFVVLVTRVILAFDLNLYIPLSKVDENMARAHSRNACHSEKFYWRQHMAPTDEMESHLPSLHEMFKSELNKSHDSRHDSCIQTDTGFEEMTIEEIMMGKGDYYPGLIPLVLAYLEHIGCDSETFERVEMYLELIRRRASGDLPTAAAWMRNFLMGHPEYQHDSLVTPSMSLDLMIACKDIGEGKRDCPELLGDLKVKPVLPESGYDIRLDSNKVRRAVANDLISKYTNRRHWDEKNLPLPVRKESESSAAAYVQKIIRADRETSGSLY